MHEFMYFPKGICKNVFKKVQFMLIRFGFIITVIFVQFRHGKA